MPLLKIQAAQQREFIWLTLGQCVLLAGSFLTRIFPLLLGAHQRYDVTNYSKIGLFAVSFGLLWLAFAHQQGVYSTLWSQGIGWFLDAAMTIGWVLRLKLLPAKGCWGRPTWNRFRELFNFGRDVFLVALGFQMLSASQALILTRVLGVEMAATWSACTRAYALLSQLVFRVFEFSAPALAEMIVRGERQLLGRRFKSLVVLSASLSVWAGTVFAICNQSFMHLWTGGKFYWSTLNDALLAVSLVFQVVTRCHIGLVGQAKHFRVLRYLYLVEGTFFVAVSLIVVPRAGVAAMLLVSIVGNLLFSYAYGCWRTSRYLELPWQATWLDWWIPPLRLAILLGPAAVIVWWLVRAQAPQPRLFAGAAFGLLAGLPLLLRYGADEDLRLELLDRVPARFRPLLYPLCGRIRPPAAAK